MIRIPLIVFTLTLLALVLLPFQLVGMAFASMRSDGAPMILSNHVRPT